MSASIWASTLPWGGQCDKYEGCADELLAIKRCFSHPRYGGSVATVVTQANAPTGMFLRHACVKTRRWSRPFVRRLFNLMWKAQKKKHGLRFRSHNILRPPLILNINPSRCCWLSCCKTDCKGGNMIKNLWCHKMQNKHLLSVIFFFVFVLQHNYFDLYGWHIFSPFTGRSPLECHLKPPLILLCFQNHSWSWWKISAVQRQTLSLALHSNNSV